MSFLSQRRAELPLALRRRIPRNPNSKSVSADDYRASLTLAKLMQDTAELLTDEAFGELFISAQSGTSSGSAQENTVESEQ